MLFSIHVVDAAKLNMFCVPVNMCARDDVESNASTFHVEMRETQSILNEADVSLSTMSIAL